MATLQLGLGLTVTCSCLFIPTSTLLTGLRFYTRHKQNAPIGADDWVMVPAFLLVVGMQITMIVEVSKKMIGYSDPHFAPGRPDARSNLALWPFEMQQTLAVSFIKLSIVLFYRRIFNTGATRLRSWYTIAMISIISAWAMSFFISFLFICGKAPAHYWTSAKTEKSLCVRTQELHLASAVSDTILDVVVMLMPVPMIWSLHMPTGRKLAVTGIFSLGLITIAASVARMVIFVQATALRYDAYLDFEYLITASIYWSMLEVGLGFMTANLIVVYGLLGKSCIRTPFRSLRGLLSLSRFSRVSSRDGDGSYQADKGRIWPTDANQSTTYAEFAGRDIEEMPLDSRRIYAKHGFGTSTESTR